MKTRWSFESEKVLFHFSRNFTCWSVDDLFFRQQREKQFLEFEAYEIASVAAQVGGLYNEDKLDILEDISTEELESIDELLHDLKVKEYSNKNEQRLNIVES